MHSIEPYYNWRELYVSNEDSRSPYFETENSEFEFTHSIYDHVIHPQWDSFGSTTLFVKIIYTDYEEQFAIIELFGEWNDCLYNDIMKLKRDLIDCLIEEGIEKFVLIGENILNFHASDDCYYEEWFEDVENGWIALINCREHVLKEFSDYNIDNYFVSGGKLNSVNWRTGTPALLYSQIQSLVERRLGFSEVW